MRPLRWFWYFIILFLFLFFVSYFLLKLPKVQNYIADRTTQIISDRLNTTVSVDRVDIDLFRGVELEEFYMEDLDGDSLIYAESFYSDFYNSVKSFYSRDFNIKSIDLRNGKIFLKRTNKDPLYNIQRLFNQSYDPYYIDTTAQDIEPLAVESDDRANKPKRFEIDVSTIYLENIAYQNIDSLGGSIMNGFFNSLKARVDTFDIHDLNFHLSDLDIEEAMLDLRRIEPDTLLRRLPPQEAVKQKDFRLVIEDFGFSQGNFALLDSRSKKRDGYLNSFDPFDFSINEIEIDADNVVVTAPYYLECQLNNLSFVTNDFDVKSSKAQRLYISKREAGLEDCYIDTGRSILKDNLVFKYRKIQDWRDFVNKVLLDFDVENSTIALRDIMYFAPTLKQNKFFQENINEKLILRGKIMGAVNRINMRDVNLRIGDNLQVKGSIIGRDFTDPGETLLNVSLDRLLTDMTTLRKLIPGFNLPSNFNKLNTIDFNGRFDGYYQDFVAYGDLVTDLGRADVDMRLNLKEGSKNASYSGKMNLFNFDLAQWTGNKDFDKLSVSANVQNGRGLEVSSAYAELGGEIIAFDFRGYRYNGIIDAKLEQNLFDGKLSILDENIDFDFLGNINFQKEVPLYDFAAEIRNIDLKALNLSPDITHVEGILDIKLKGTSIDNVIGSALGNNISIVRENDSRDTLDFGHLALASTIDENGIRSIFLDSDVGDAEIVGEYKLTELPDAVISLAKRNYPAFTDRLKLINKEPNGQVKANFQVSLYNSNELLSFFAGEEAKLEKVKMQGRIDYLKNALIIDLNAPLFKFGDISSDNLRLNFVTRDNVGTFDLRLDSSSVGNILVEKLKLYGSVAQDSVKFNVSSKRIVDSLTNVEIAGVLSPLNNQIYLSLDQLNFDVLGDTWNLSNNNEIILGDEYLSLKNVSLTDEFRSIRLRSTNDNKGIETDVKDLQLFLVNRWIRKDNFVLNGDITANISLENLFKMEGLFVKSTITDVQVNEQNMGTLTVDAATDLKTKTIAYDILLDNVSDQVTLNGLYDLVTKEIDANLIAEGFPLVFLENFLGDGISETKGSVYADMQVKGQFDDLSTLGNGEVRDGFTRINYLGTRYSFEDAKFKIKKNYLDFTGSQLRDSREQVARVTGGITHNSFRDLGCNVNIRSDQFVLLNTDYNTNPTYYGFGQGKASVDIQGLFTNISLFIEATTGKDTRMTMPVTSVNTTRDQSFIPIVTREDFIAEYENKDKVNVGSSYVGMNLEMQLHVTPAAEMTILFDPISGHKLTGTGRGDIQLLLDPSGEIKMQGSYNVDQGKYDFALQNFIKKEFIIRSDGKVTWSGDPLNAEINIEADYKRLRAPLSIFLAEFIANNPDLQSIANQEEEVLLTVNLTDKLLNPTINFDIEFPNLNGQLRSFAENKLATLKSDPLGLNNQVFGLLIFNNFIPYDNPIANTNIGSSFNVIVSELLSAQLSAYVSSIFESVLNENGLIYNVDVDVRLENTGLTSANNTNYGLTVTPKFNSDKFEIVLAGDYLSGNGTLNPYASGDFIVDYFFEEDRKLKLRIYGRSDRDIINGRFTKLGTGLYARREFSNFRDLRKSFRKVAKEIEKLEKEKEENLNE